MWVIAMTRAYGQVRGTGIIIRLSVMPTVAVFQSAGATARGLLFLLLGSLQRFRLFNGIFCLVVDG